MTTEELISRAKRNIGSSEISLRAAAEDIARAYDQGATQREVAQGVGKSAAWVNRLLKWRENGYVGAPFSDNRVQGVNKKALPLDPAAAGAALASNACTQSDTALTVSIPHTNISGLEPADTVLGKNDSADSADPERVVCAVERPEAPESVDTASALAPATKMLTTDHAQTSGVYHTPAACNRQDPERAFQRLAEQWSSDPFRGLFLDSPKIAQERFLRDVLLPELSGPEAVSFLPSGQGGGQ